jgi:arginine decarboxylase
MSMPGERLGGPESPVIKLIVAMEQFGKRFPGFEREVHGIEVDGEGNYWMRAVIEEPEKKRSKSKKRRPAVEPPINSPRLPSRPVRHSTE